ncbi:MAG TPA: hypothetical protein VI522_04080, partial [Gammaproteobacteria bacterium]|nr:hypothetical protein [Gammaproteobacteria bacterium]
PKQAPKAVSQIAQVLALIPTVTDTGVAEKARSSLIDLTVTGAGSQVAYIANRDSNNSIAICPVNTDGSLASCASHTDPSFFNPIDIILNNDATIAYVANVDFSTPPDTHTISVCHVHPDGTLGTCSAFSDPNDTLDLYYTGLRLNSENTLLYATGYFNNTVSICPVAGNGALSACVEYQNNDFHGPSGRLVFNFAGLPAYVPNYNSFNSDFSVAICNSQFASCISAVDASFFHPLAMDINASGKHVYVANYGNDTVSICEILSTGTLDTCTFSTGDDVGANPTFDFSISVANLFVHNYNGFGYFPNEPDDTISICPINNLNGAIGVCTVFSDADITSPGSVWISTFDI